MASTSDPFSEDKALLARVDDAVRLCKKRPIVRFIGFLDEHQAAVAGTYLKKRPDVRYRFFGGCADARRVVLGVSGREEVPDDDEFPIDAIGFSYRTTADVTHRDVLGSLIGCGITRDKIGDIFCFDGLSVAYVHRDLAAFIAQSVDRIGREGVTVRYPFEDEIETAPTLLPLSGTVASARLDAVLKVLLNVSREKAADLIRTSLVQVDHQPVTSVSRLVKAGEVLSVRGYGRYAVEDLSDTTKKGRLVLRAVQYV